MQSPIYVDFHLLQNVAPSLLNRDDTGAHKDALFGGVRRARISSQCQKRAMREHWRHTAALPKDEQAVRTQYLLQALVERLAALGRPASEAAARVRLALGGLKLQADDDGRSQYLLFLGADELNRLAAVIAQYWDMLMPAEAVEPEAESGAGKKPVKTSKKAVKAAAKDACPAEVITALEQALTDTRSLEVRLFGRMLADRPSFNSDASLQVAHALGTAALEREFDFFTAVDDLQAQDSAGAGHLGQLEFASTCFYRYATLNLRELHALLGRQRESTERALRLLGDAITHALPSGKQNTFAAHQKPAFVGIQIGTQPRSLANAFEKPIRVRRDGLSLTGKSVRQLDTFRQRLNASYGETGAFYFHDLSDAKLQGGRETVGAALTVAMADALQRLG
ncbi:type I-E CRISPR-associated protein Cas7/Cse4/CasC [Silanimonas sp.]|uniref:type I-E CRISPR-associated protein Cas7/Cse4/CasC n=1 Tax=Silanimonas sp. TaxID=1929290 RepID=UPI001BBB76BF|nr:type I-E CRISPR-associated protein Cas7/Cse4/CasC [Silanimonas sp.]MBS3896246.1 type I-E CRISPR-associated protein Cas7/Cse4/CasC [Silanimonas sp.]